MTRPFTPPAPSFSLLRALWLCGSTAALFGACKDYTCAETATCPLQDDAGVDTVSAPTGTAGSSSTDVFSTSGSRATESDVTNTPPPATSSSPAANPTSTASSGPTSDPALTSSADTDTTSPDDSSCNTCDETTSPDETSFVCDDKCQSGEARCDGGELERCEPDTDGCFDWTAPITCDPASCATATSCAVCDNQCSVGETDCSDGNLRTCVADTQGCLDWSAPSACSTGTCSSSSECFVCDNQCTSGSYSCSGSQLRSCTADDRGCYDFTLESTCGGNTPACSADNERCECQSGAAPTCANSTTVSQCSNGVWANTACTGNTPVCVAGEGCQACTEHSQCPNSACHLAGTKKGTCFATNTVVNVNSAASLLNAVNATTDDGESVIKLSAGTYTMTSGFGPKGETAIIGQTGVIIVDNMPFPGDARASFLGSQGITYVYKIRLNNTTADHTGIGGSTGSMLWLDDSQIGGQAYGVLTNGEVHLRRTSIYGYDSGGALAYYGGSLFIENSTIGPAAASASDTEGVGARFGAVLDVRYSTIVGNEYGVGCIVGDSIGRIANSIIASNLNGDSIASASGDCSEAFTLVTNAIDQTGYGTKIPVYSSTWFVSANNGDLHLSAAGKVAIPTIAVRGADDPLLDIDGNPRPANAGYPGADQP